MEFRTAYGPKLRQVFNTEGPALTRQDMKEECDINNIMAQYQRSGLVDHVAKHDGQYGEFAALDYHEAMNAVIEAEEMFQTVPSEIRSQFDNDPGKFLAFVNNPENEVRMAELGLLAPKKAAEVLEANAPPPPPPPAEPAAQ